MSVSYTHLDVYKRQTVYGNPSQMPITEDFPLSTPNPYGTKKLMLEQILKDAAKADTAVSYTHLDVYKRHVHAACALPYCQSISNL